MTTKIHLFDRDTNTREYTAGEAIFKAGEQGDEMFIVREGIVDIVYNGKVINSMEAGDVFGEMAVIDHSPRSADAIARTDVVVVPVNEQRFDTMVQITPNFARKMMLLLTERLRQRLTNLTEAGLI